MKTNTTDRVKFFSGRNTKLCSCCGKKVKTQQLTEVFGKSYCRICYAELEAKEPVKVSGNCIYYHSDAYLLWKTTHVSQAFELNPVIALTDKTPVLEFYEDDSLACTYVLETEDGEDFSGKWFHASVRLNTFPDGIVSVQTDGYVSEDKNSRKFGSGDIGYRMEGYISRSTGEKATRIRRQLEGSGLVAKGLKYPGYITPGNVRLIGICSSCGKSLVFHSINYPMMQSIPCYSDDGTEVCGLAEPLSEEDKQLWTHNINGLTFRYNNPFRCRYCGAPYIDYQRKTRKVYGDYGCLYLGHKTFE